MVTITDGKVVCTVTNGAYREVYSKQGFKICGAEEPKPEVSDPVDPDDEFVKSVEEKPLAQWSKDDIKKYASIFGIDISGTRNVEDARVVIRKYREEADAE